MHCLHRPPLENIPLGHTVLLLSDLTVWRLHRKIPVVSEAILYMYEYSSIFLVWRTFLPCLAYGHFQCFHVQSLA